jgi:hypothetical protein
MQISINRSKLYRFQVDEVMLEACSTTSTSSRSNGKVSHQLLLTDFRIALFQSVVIAWCMLPKHALHWPSSRSNGRSISPATISPSWLQDCIIFQSVSIAWCLEACSRREHVVEIKWKVSHQLLLPHRLRDCIFFKVSLLHVKNTWQLLNHLKTVRLLWPMLRNGSCYFHIYSYLLISAVFAHNYSYCHNYSCAHIYSCVNYSKQLYCGFMNNAITFINRS